MTWLDPLFVLAVLAFTGLGWARGSVWFSSGLAAGFVGLWAADIYGPVASSVLGGWRGAEAVGTILVFIAVAALVVAVGWVLRKILSAAFLSFVDRLSGLVVGAVLGTALVVVALAVLFAVKPDWKELPVLKDSFFASRLQTRVLSMPRLPYVKRFPL